MKLKKWTIGIFSLGLVLSSCSGNNIDENVQIFFDRAETARELNQNVYDAIVLTNTDVEKAIFSLSAICPQANKFLESQYGDNGWERGEFPEKYQAYETAMTASVFACDLTVNLKEESWGTFARYSAQFLQYYKCLESPFFTDTDACPPYGLFAE
jgi:hypothetical protein